MSAEAVVDQFGVPAGRLADVVAACADAAPVGQAGRAAEAMRADVVGMADGGVAVGVAAAAVVADADQLGEEAVEGSAAGIAADQRGRCRAT
jgi:hypothetical protein